MSAPRLSVTDAIAAYGVAERIGAAFAEARRDAGHRQADVADVLRIEKETVSRFETGREKNVKIGTVVRMLSLYRLTIAVIPARQEIV